MHKIVLLFLLVLCSAPLHSDEVLHRAAVETMVKATRYFRSQVATNGGYLWLYQSDFTRRQGEGIASPTTIWVQPPGTPSVGMAFLQAYEATGDTLFLNGAVEAAQALVWGQLASGGWDYRIDFDPAGEQKMALPARCRTGRPHNRRPPQPHHLRRRQYAERPAPAHAGRSAPRLCRCGYTPRRPLRTRILTQGPIPQRCLAPAL